jgi:hypothetical protein
MIDAISESTPETNEYLPTPKQLDAIRRTLTSIEMLSLETDPNLSLHQESRALIDTAAHARLNNLGGSEYLMSTALGLILAMPNPEESAKSLSSWFENKPALTDRASQIFELFRTVLEGDKDRIDDYTSIANDAFKISGTERNARIGVGVVKAKKNQTPVWMLPNEIDTLEVSITTACAARIALLARRGPDGAATDTSASATHVEMLQLLAVHMQKLHALSDAQDTEES